jgi:hypothetical protein
MIARPPAAHVVKTGKIPKLADAVLPTVHTALQAGE